MKSAQEMSGKMQEINDQLRGQRVEGAAGGGMVKVEANGLGEILRVSIEPGLIERGDHEMVEDLLPAAINDAIVNAKQLHADSMKSLTSDMNLPGLDEALEKFAGGHQGGGHEA